MSEGDNYWMDRAQSAEARLNTLKDSIDPMKQRIQKFKENFGVRERSDGSIVVDYNKFVRNLGAEGALELRRIIDEVYNIRGAPGEKPKMRIPAA